ncbi:hypothetical protein [Bradyrhizobium aeschynomenes]|uniref:hypothetical protein n=1 Tax=Bradyrhizobium aeschynomenes TaxID=2734909 RepID=UPI001556F856|nr:hypothetical protein [Bradyrhizobium aeschynomenes]NPV25408.1 hypothetical protein [Bradyrhizobium aeschynomenes]
MAGLRPGHPRRSTSWKIVDSGPLPVPLQAISVTIPLVRIDTVDLEFSTGLDVVTDPIGLRFDTEDDLLAFERAMSEFFWTENFEGAEHALDSAMDGHPSTFSEICRATPQTAVSIRGWDELYAQIESPSRRNYRCSAIEIDLSGHADREIAPGLIEPGFECSYFDDSMYPFSMAEHHEMLARCKAGCVPWQGGFFDIDYALTCEGLGRLYAAILGYPHRYWRPRVSSGEAVPPDFVSYTLACWFLYLRAHQAIWLKVSTRGLPQQVPVVVGQHDFGPGLLTVYMPEKVHDSRAATARIVAQGEAEARAFYDKITEDEIRGLRERRDGIRRWPFFWNRKQRKLFVDYSMAHEKLILGANGLSPSRPTWKMSDQAFESLIARYRTARASHQSEV